MELQGKVALGTGGAHRVGRALTLALATAGCDVFIHYGRSADAAEQTATQARALGVRATTGSLDLARTDELPGLIDQAADALGPVRVLVNSASGFAEDTAAGITPGQWQATLAVTLTAPIFLTQAMARALPDDEDGAVVNVTDWRTARPYPDHFGYVVAKGGLEAFTRAAAVGLAPRVRVNAVALGAILPPPGKDHGYLKELAGELPLRRAGTPELVADAVLFLLRNDFVSGEIVRVDGAAHLA